MQQICCWLCFIFPPERAQSAHDSPHSLRYQVRRCTLVASTHTCASEWASRSSHPPLEGVVFRACRQGNAALHGVDTPTLPICLGRYPLLLLLDFFYFLKSLSAFVYKTVKPSCQLVIRLLLAEQLFLFLQAELVQDFKSWLTDLKLELTDCFTQSGDVVVLRAKLQRLKVLSDVTVYRNGFLLI